MSVTLCQEVGCGVKVRWPTARWEVGKASFMPVVRGLEGSLSHKLETRRVITELS